MDIEKKLEKLSNNPKDLDLLEEIADYYMDGNKYKKVIKYYERIREIDEDNENAYFNLGVIYGKMALQDIEIDEYWEDKTDEEDFFENAVKNYLICIELNPENKYAYNNLAILYEAFDWQDKAKEMIDKSLEIDPDQDDLKELRDELEL